MMADQNSTGNDKLKEIRMVQGGDVLLETVFASVPVGLGFLDLNLRYARLNEALARINGLPVEAHLGKTPAELVPGLDQINQMMATWRRILVTGESIFNVETTGETAAAPGETRYWLSHWYPVRQDGEIIGIGVMVEDITDRRRAEAALQESEKRYSSLFENNHAVMLLIDPQTGDIVDANPAACAFYGYSQAELKQKTVADLNTLENEKVTRNMELARLGQKQQFYFQHRLASGEIRDVEVYSGLITVRGRQLLYSIIHDISERRRAETKLQEREELFRQLAENIRHVFWMRDIEQNQMVYVSPAYEEVWGRSPASLYEDPASFIEAIHPEDRPRVTAALQQQNEHELFNEEYRIIRPDGSIRWIWARSFPVPNEQGQVYRLAGIAEDISQGKQVEQALEEQAQLIDLAHNGIMVWDQEARIVSWNTGAEETYGWSKAEVLGQNVHVLLRTEFPEPLPAINARLLQQERWEGELVQYNRQGERLVVASRWAVQRDKDGWLARVMEINVDITELRRAEQVQRLLAEAGQILSASLDYETTLARLARLAVPVLADWCAVYVVESNQAIRQLEVVHVNPAQVDFVSSLQQRYPLHQNVPGSLSRVLQTGQVEHHPDITDEMLAEIAQNDEHLQLLRKLQIKSAMLVPLTARERTLGAMLFIQAESGYRYNRQDLALAQELARRAALAIDNARLYQEAQTEVTARRQAEARLKGLLEEKEVLLKEVHHRVKNNLQAVTNLLYLQSVYTGDETIRQMLREMQDRIKSIALIHEKLYQTEDFTRLDFAAYLTSLGTQLIHSYRADPATVRLNIEVGETALDMDTAVPIGIVINELVSNALKHAFLPEPITSGRPPDEISIQLQADSNKGEYLLVVDDNGIGLPDTVDLAHPESLGLQLVQMLISHMGGVLEIERQGGTKFKIRFASADR